MAHLLTWKAPVGLLTRRVVSSISTSSTLSPQLLCRQRGNAGAAAQSQRPRGVILSAAMAVRGSSSSNDDMAGSLREQTCVGKCGRDTPRLSDEAIDKHISALPDWRLNDERTIISKSFVARHFVAAMDFFNAVKDLAEAETHHPDLHLTNYRNVRVDVWTHSIGGLALPDFILAAKIDQLEVDYSPKWLREKDAKGGTA